MRRLAEDRRSLLVVLALALAARVALALWVYPSRWNMDPDYYDGLAQGLVSHGELSSDIYGRHSVFREPGWPILLAVPYALGGRGIVGIMILQLVLALGGIALLYELGRRWLSAEVGLAAAFLAAVHPSLIYYTVYPFREIAYFFFALAAVLALLEAKSAAGFAGAGLAHAWTGLISTTHLPFAAAAPLVLAWKRRNIPARALAAFYLALAAGYSPWPIRNYVVWKGFIPGTLYAAENLYKVMLVPHEARATPTERRLLEGDPIMHRWMQTSNQDPVAANNLLNDVIKRRMKEDPLVVVRNAPFHAWKLWRPMPYDRQYRFNYRLLFWTGLASDGWLIPLGFLGLALALTRRGRTGELAAIGAAWIGALTAVHAMSFAMTRHRVPVMGIVMLFAAWMVIEGFHRWRGEEAS